MCKQALGHTHCHYSKEHPEVGASDLQSHRPDAAIMDRALTDILRVHFKVQEAKRQPDFQVW